MHKTNTSVGKRNRNRLPAAPGKASPKTALRRAHAFHQAGQHTQARQIYDDILRVDPAHADALRLRGALYLQTGAYDRALDDLDTASQFLTQDASVFSNKSAALFRLGRLEEAETSAQRAIAIDPDNASAHNNLGNALRRQFRVSQARAAFERAIAVDPDHAQARANLIQLNTDVETQDVDDPRSRLHTAVGLYEKRAYDAAECIALAAVERDPKHADLHNLLGAIYMQTGKYDRARARYEIAVSLRPGGSVDLQELSHALRRLGRIESSVNAANRAIDADPTNAHGFYRLAEALMDAADAHGTMRALNRAIELKPDFAKALNLRGLVLSRVGRSAEAAVSYLEALQYLPDDTGILANLGTAFRDQGRLLEAYEYYVMATEGPRGAAVHSNALLCLQYVGDLSPEAIYDAHLEWAQRHAVPLLPEGPQHAAVDRNVERKLRIGYVSPDFRMHSVSFFFEPVLDWQDRDRYEIVLYSDAAVPDATTERMQTKADIFRPIADTPDDQLASIIRGDRIDILVDLAGHTAGNRQLAFARKPAPIQISWLGYPDTTGNPSIDYRVSDAITDPEGVADALSTEKLLRLPTGFHAYRPAASAPPVEPHRSDRTAPIIFGSFNAIQKITNKVVRVWAEILKKVPDSQLLLKHKSMSDPVTRARYLGLFEQAGIDPQRIIIRKNIREIDSHLAAYNMIDIALDPFPYNGTTTTCEALWMGVPVISKLGDRHASRVTGSLLNTVGLQELVADDDQDYVARAVAIANDRDRLGELRSQIREMVASSPLCDERTFVQHFEAALRKIWQDFAKPA